MHLLRAIRWRVSGPPAPTTFLVSYPKSGRTWLRVLIGRYLSSRYRLPERRILQTEWLTHHAGLPVAAFSHDGSAMKDRRHCRDMDYRRSDYADRKVLLLTRNFKDTLVSSYFHQTQRDKNFTGELSEYVRSEYYGLPKLLAFYRAWERDHGMPVEFRVVRYEDLHRDPVATLVDVLRFLGEKNPSMRVVEESVRYGSFDNLRVAEEENRFNDGILSTREGKHPDSYKVRRGKVGGWVDDLSPDDAAYVDAMVNESGLRVVRPAVDA